jgi:hypothetical protein
LSDRFVKVSLVIDDHGSVKVMRTAGEESSRTEGKLKHLDRGVKELGKSFGGLKGMIGMGLGAGSLVFGLKDVISKTSEITEETHKFRTMTGIGAQASLDYTAALRATGVGVEAGANAFKFLAKNMFLAERQFRAYDTAQAKAEAKGKTYTGALGIQANAFRELLGPKGLGALSKLGEQQKLERVTKAFSKMTDGAKKTRLEGTIFGRGGTALSPVLNEGALSLDKFDKMAKKFYPTLKSGAHVEEELLGKQAESKLAWEGLEYTLGEKMIPAVISVNKWFTKLTLEIKTGHGVFGKLGVIVKDVVTVFKSLFGWLTQSKLGVDMLAFGITALLGVMAVNKVTGFFGTFKTAVGGLAGESAAFGGAGRMLGLAFAVAFGIAMVPGVKKAGEEALEALGLAKRKESPIDTMIKYPATITAASLKGLSPSRLKELQHIGRVDHERHYPSVLFKTPAQIGSTAAAESQAAGRAMAAVERQYNHPHASAPAQPIHIHVHTTSVIDGREVAKNTTNHIIGDGQMRRLLAEGVAIHGSKMAALGNH